MQKVFLIITGFLFSFFSYGQSPETYTSSEIFQQIKKLNVLASVLYVAAHPDDENNALLPFFAKEELYRTAYLSLTRGDGGQNLIGDEQGIELGLIRTEELLAARKVDGAEQYFSRAYEFGFSKSAAEALRIWNKEKILSDVVWVIRKFQPDVIIKRFPPDKRAGHGHHAASSILAQEAFSAAADPKMFPEQFKYGVKPWQAKRILWNTYNFGGNNTTSEDQLKIDIGGYNPLIGKSYGELGGEARTMHKSQGEGRPRRRGESFEYFLTTGGEAPKNNNLMDGVITDWKRIPGGERIETMVNLILSNFSVAHPDLSVAELVELYKAIKALPEGNWRDKKLDEVQQIIVECSALFVEATSSQPQVVQSGSLAINFNLIKRENVNASLKKVSVDHFDSAFTAPLVTNQNFNLNKTIPVADNEKISQPYWLVYPLEGGNFEVRDQTLIGKAWNDPSFEASFVVTIDDEDFIIKRPVQYRYIDPVKGDTYQPIPVLPKIEVRYAKDNYLSINNKPVTTANLVKFNSSGPEWTVHPPLNSMDIHLEQKFSNNWIMKNDSSSDPLIFKNTFVPKAKDVNLSEEISASVKKGNETYDHYTKVISYNHIPTITYFPRATTNLVELDIKIVGKKIGYIAGAGDKVPEALQAMGYEVTTLTAADITDEKLREYDAIITGIRAYNLFEYLSDKNDVLMRYVKNGGNMIVQYLKSNQVGDKNITVGPYPFKISSGSRVTEEDAKVDFLLPDNPVLNYPDKITQHDFDGWIQERSTYQAITLDPKYETPLSMHDTGEEPSNGSLAIAKYGKGNFVYASLVFFRELP
nr:PIG-L family deacetylase [Bacteroidota bacterium]